MECLKDTVNKLEKYATEKFEKEIVEKRHIWKGMHRA